MNCTTCGFAAVLPTGLCRNCGAAAGPPSPQPPSPWAAPIAWASAKPQSGQSAPTAWAPAQPQFAQAAPPGAWPAWQQPTWPVSPAAAYGPPNPAAAHGPPNPAAPYGPPYHPTPYATYAPQKGSRKPAILLGGLGTLIGFALGFLVHLFLQG